MLSLVVQETFRGGEEGGGKNKTGAGQQAGAGLAALQ